LADYLSRTREHGESSMHIKRGASVYADNLHIRSKSLILKWSDMATALKLIHIQGQTRISHVRASGVEEIVATYITARAVPK
jgi:predicted glutamine amidotransferase